MYISASDAMFIGMLLGFILGIVFMILLAFTWRGKK